MTQPAKSQEPSMEEILASIRRIIADDDASKSAQRAAEPPKPAPRPAPPPRMPEPEPEPEPEPIVAEAQPEELPMPPEPEPEPEPEEDQASDILDLTESMAAPAAAPQFRKIEGFSDVSFDEAEPPKPAMPQADASSLALEVREWTAFERHQRGGRFRVQRLGADRAGAERAHARGSGARDAASDAEILARRQSSRHGRAPGASRDRARRPRALAASALVAPKRRLSEIRSLIGHRNAWPNMAMPVVSKAYGSDHRCRWGYVPTRSPIELRRTKCQQTAIISRSCVCCARASD